MSFRIMNTQNYDVFMNMALDHACLDGVAAGEVSPTIRVFGVSEPSVSVGCFECLTDVLRMDEVSSDSLAVTRRVSGGGCFFHDQEVLFSVIVPENVFSENVMRSYGQVLKPVLRALSSVGVDAKFRPLDDIVVGSKKVGVSAQTRKDGVLLMQGSVLLSVDEARFSRYLRADCSSIAGVLDFGVSSQEVLQALRRELMRAFRASAREWSDDELSSAKQLRKHYADQEWVARR